MTIQENLRLDRPRLAPDIVSLIGNTPLVEISLLKDQIPDVRILAKVEYFNPGGSVKDRAALRIIEDGERSGELTHEKVIMDSTSGNTGIAYAMIGAAKGFRVELVMPENVSSERKRIIESYGAKLTFSSPFEGSDGAIMLAEQLSREAPWRYFYRSQYKNRSNWMAHYDTTGVEIIRQTGGDLTHFVACVGTSGTLMGNGRRLKEFNPNIQVVAVQPSEAMHGLEGMKHYASSLVPEIYDATLPDDTVYADTEQAYDFAKLLACKEGLLVGQSSGAALAGVLQVGKKIGKGTIVTVFPDSGNRYLTTQLFGFHGTWSI
ncbi:MAG: cysteine synthase family protein [Nitrospirota bacterium]|nr:cysteine synthase family protein [Nitrospirota bacterium]